MATTDEIVDAKLDEMLEGVELGEPKEGLPESRSAQDVVAENDERGEVKEPEPKLEPKEYTPRKDSKVLGKIDLKGPARGPDGKFAPKVEVPAEPAPQAAPEPVKPIEPVIYPRSYSPEMKQGLQKLPPEAQKLALDHIKRVESEVYGKAQRFERDMGFARAVKQEAQPYEEEIRRSGKNPMQVYPQMLAWHRALESNPKQAIEQLAQLYGQKAPQLQPGQYQQQPQQSDEALARVEALETHLRMQQVQMHVDSWKSQKDANGEPAFPYADDLAEEMAPIVQALRQSMPNEAPSNILTRAYRVAIADHPEIQEALTQKAEARAKATALKNGTADAQKMRRAAVSPRPGSNGTPQRLLPRDTGSIIDGLFDGSIEPI